VSFDQRLTPAIAQPRLTSGLNTDTRAMWQPAHSSAEPSEDQGEHVEFVIDLEHAEIVSATLAARRLFLGKTEPCFANAVASAGAFALSLDRAMPALAALAPLAEKGREARLTLVLWTARGVQRIDADCTPLTSPPDERRVRIVQHTSRPPVPSADRRQRLNGHAGIDPASTSPHPSPDPDVSRMPAAKPPIVADLARQSLTTGLRAAAVRASGATPPPPLSFQADPELTRRTVGDWTPADANARPSAAPVEPADAALSSTRPDAELTALNSGLPTPTDVRLAKLAHEIRTPLSAVVALAEIMRDEQLGPLANARYRGYAADIYESTRHALALLEVALEDETTKPDAATLTGLTLDPNRVIASAVSAMHPFADRAGVMLVAELRPRLPAPAIEQRALTQVLYNLLTNAFNHTPRGGRIVVSAEARGGDGWLALRVEDTGRGMSEAQVKAALARSVADGRAGSSPSGSTGFGLPIIRDAVLAAGGTLDITSVVGHGTRIVIALPPRRTC
jgi:signal transduction histidine kinase